MNRIKFVSALAASIVFASSAAHATDANVTPGAAQTVTYTVTAGNYVATGFAFNVSASVGLKSNENTTAIAVRTANTKGRNNFSGHSNGGSVGVCGTATTGSTAPTVGNADVTLATGCSAAAGTGT
jgi:hypothetical protein